MDSSSCKCYLFCGIRHPTNSTMMLNTKKHKHFEVPILVNGSIRYIKGVTKHTTCGDVIKMVLKKSPAFGQDNGHMDSYAIFESSRGIERVLPGKNRLVEVMRSWGTDSNFDFVFRKTNPMVSAPKISEANRRKLNQRMHTQPESKNVPGGSRKDKQAVAAKLAALVHSQKTKLRRYESLRNTEFVKELYFKDSDDSMDEFISYVDQRNMEGILNFCGTVTESKMNKLLSVSHDGMQRDVTGRSTRSTMVDSSHVSQTNVNNVKYAVKKTLKSKVLSTSSICDSSNTDNKMIARPLKHKVIDISPVKEPVHSTPHSKVSKPETRLAKRHEELACDITNKVARMNQRAGKDALLQKYFADYLTYNSPGRQTHTSRRTRGDRAEDEHVAPICRRGDGAEENQFSPAYVRGHRSMTHDEDDTDSGQEEEVSNFDIAFIDENANIPECETKCVGKLVDYSFSDSETSFASEPSFISKASDVSSVSDIVKNVFSDIVDKDEDDLVESFMKTKHLEDFFSDEGMSSMGTCSDYEKEIIV